MTHMERPPTIVALEARIRALEKALVSARQRIEVERRRAEALEEQARVAWRVSFLPPVAKSAES